MTVKLLLISAFSLLHLILLDAKQLQAEQIKYISPVPESKYNNTETNIILKFDEPILNPDRLNSDLLVIKGSKSGIHKGRIVITGNQKTLLFYPFEPFQYNETVTVELKNTGNIFSRITPDLKYSFHTSARQVLKRNINNSIIENIIKESKSYPSAKSEKPYENRITTLPGDYPNIIVEENNSAPGVVSLAPFMLIQGNIVPSYMLILDKSGYPMFYRKVTAGILDFKMQENGLLTYFDMGTGQYYVMDDQLKVIDSVSMKNGYPTDLHELVITEDNHYLMMSYDVQKVRMDTIVTGGNPDANVTGLIIQELDENKDVVFQWRSWDHYKITDATPNIDLTAADIDYVHGNAIELDTDGNFMISNRHMDEITKINRETGDIIWRWGGRYCKNNEFTFVNDSIGFSHQHDIRRLPNGNVMLFDNGNLHTPPFSRSVEYTLDEQTKTATLVWEYRHEPWTFSFAMGSSRRLENGNTFIGWGWNSGTPSISEVTPEGENTFYLTLPDTVFNYRAFKFIWKQGVFSADSDELLFGNILPGASLESTIAITNNSGDSIKINEVYITNNSFILRETLPITINPGETREIAVLFEPDSGGIYDETIYLGSKKDGEMINLAINLYGTADTSATAVDDQSSEIVYSLEQNYPNPFNPATVISYSIAEESFVKLKIYDILGREVASLKNEVQKPGKYTIEFNAEQLASGIYYYSLDTEGYSSTKKMILLR